MQPSAKVIAHSVGPHGIEVVTFEAVMHRFVLAEFNTHCQLARNSASSRAIPVSKQLAKVQEHPAWPLVWASEQPGMQGGTELEGGDLWDAKGLFAEIHEHIVVEVENYIAAHPDPSTRLHKSLINRLLEPFMWHTVIATSTDWKNFFHQRSSQFSPLAQPEIMAVADAMLQELRLSTPTDLDYGEWHLPYISGEDLVWAKQTYANEGPATEALKRISTARCARVSYLTHDGVRDQQEDLKLWTKLTSADPMHASPLEHPCTPVAGASEGKFRGWRQHRHEVLPHQATIEPTGVSI